MKVSLGEVDAMLRKAARGAGWPWGFAEELGASGRALEAAGLPGIAVGTALLQHDNPAQCPVRAAATACDYNAFPTEPLALQCPIIALPLIARHFHTPDTAVSASMGGMDAIADGSGWVTVISGDFSNAKAALPITFELVTATGNAPRKFLYGVNVADDDWHALEAFAMGSYVPASEQSRQGAGPSE